MSVPGASASTRALSRNLSCVLARPLALLHRLCPSISIRSTTKVPECDVLLLRRPKRFNQDSKGVCEGLQEGTKART